MATVTATTASEVLHALETERAARGVSKAELSRRSRVRAQTVRRLLTDKYPNPTLINVLDMLRPLGLGIGLVELPEDSSRSREDEVCAWLSFYGAPLYGSTALNPNKVPKIESVLAEGLKVSRDDATVARALPIALWKNRKRIEMQSLREEAGRWNQSRTLGFFLDLTAQLSGEAPFRREAAELHLRVPLKTTQFFQPTTQRERQLAELKTPDVARRWGFRMNMGLDSFVSMFKKGKR